MKERLDRIKREFPWLKVQDMQWLIDKVEESVTPKCKASDFHQSPRHYLNVFYEAFGKPPTAYQIEDITYWLDLGMEEGLLALSFEKASRAGANFNYAMGILRRWHKAGIMTLEQAQDERKEKAHDEKREGDTRHTGGGYYW